jgi:ABC-type uncharacterized transport system permease subunit
MHYAIICFTLIVNTLVATILAIRYRKLVVGGLLAEVKAKRHFSWFCFACALVCGFIVYGLIIEISKVLLGHNDIVAGPIFNLLLSPVLVFYGRVIIGWETMKW